MAERNQLEFQVHFGSIRPIGNGDGDLSYTSFKSTLVRLDHCLDQHLGIRAIALFQVHFGSIRPRGRRGERALDDFSFKSTLVRLDRGIPTSLANRRKRGSFKSTLVRLDLPQPQAAGQRKSSLFQVHFGSIRPYTRQGKEGFPPCFKSTLVRLDRGIGSPDPPSEASVSSPLWFD